MESGQGQALSWVRRGPGRDRQGFIVLKEGWQRGLDHQRAVPEWTAGCEVKTLGFLGTAAGSCVWVGLGAEPGLHFLWTWGAGGCGSRSTMWDSEAALVLVWGGGVLHR